MTKKEVKDVVEFLFPSTPRSMNEETIRALEERFTNVSERQRVVSIIGEGMLNNLEDVPDEVYEKLFEEYYIDCEDMPYGTKKARDGDPHRWMYERITRLNKHHI